MPSTITFELNQAVYACWITLAVTWLTGAFFAKPTRRVQPGREFFQYISLAIIGGIIFSGGIMEGTRLDGRFLPATAASRLAGFLCTLAGTLVAIWARLILGSNWSGRATVKEGHELVTRGPYSLVRHPIYTGILLALTGTVLLHGRYSALLGFAVVGSALWIKLRQEERLMTETFPQQYPDYRRRVKALVPFVF